MVRADKWVLGSEIGSSALRSRIKGHREKARRVALRANDVELMATRQTAHLAGPPSWQTSEPLVTNLLHDGSRALVAIERLLADRRHDTVAVRIVARKTCAPSDCTQPTFVKPRVEAALSICDPTGQRHEQFGPDPLPECGGASQECYSGPNQSQKIHEVSLFGGSVVSPHARPRPPSSAMWQPSRNRRRTVPRSRFARVARWTRRGRVSGIARREGIP